jgi:hypothetical protein
VFRSLEPGDELPDATTLPPGGYAVLVDEAGEVSSIAADRAGERHALATIAQLDGAASTVVIDWPELSVRGVIEGFYGGPWSHQQRLDLMRLSSSLKLNSYVYAPKDDPYHRMQWRSPYPPAQLAQLGELVAAAADNGVDFVYALHPAMSMRFSDDAEHAALAAKAEQLWSIGVPTIALLFDDVPPQLVDEADVAAFGADPGALGRAHGTTCARFERDAMRPRGIAGPLVMVPTDYAGDDPSPYRTALAETLPSDALVWWTGPDIVVGAIGRDDIDRAAVSFGRELLLWDNFPVNDFDRTRAFLGPLSGRTTDLLGSAIRGITANPMVEYAPSAFAIASIADWAWNPAGYDERRSAAAALQFVAGDDAETLAPLVSVLSSWPPSAPSHVRLGELLVAALRGEVAGELDSLLAGLAHVAPRESHGLEPWIAASRAWGAAASAALDLLKGRGDAAATRRLLGEAETHYANVARDVLPGFVRTVLSRFEPAPDAGSGPFVRIIGDADPAVAEHLARRGFRLDGSDAPALAIVAPGGDAAELPDAVPTLAWGHLAALGLADEHTLTQTGIIIVAEGHPLAAGLTGRVDVYRGPWFMNVGEPIAEDAVVVARTVFESRPAIVHYPSRRAVAFFFGRDGGARWLVSDEGARLFDAAIDLLLG